LKDHYPEEYRVASEICAELINMGVLPPGGPGIQPAVVLTRNVEAVPIPQQAPQEDQSQNRDAIIDGKVTRDSEEEEHNDPHPPHILATIGKNG
jgi:hypothetical protein